MRVKIESCRYTKKRPSMSDYRSCGYRAIGFSVGMVDTHEETHYLHADGFNQVHKLADLIYRYTGKQNGYHFGMDYV